VDAKEKDMKQPLFLLSPPSGPAQFIQVIPVFPGSKDVKAGKPMILMKIINPGI